MTQRDRTPILVLGAAFLLGFFVMDSLFVVSPLLTLIMNEFSLSFAVAGLLFSVPLFFFVLSSFFAGALSDKVGFKKAAGIGALFLAIGSPTRAFVQDFIGLLTFTAFLGLAYGFLLPSLPKMVSGWFEKAVVGKATGIYINGLMLGAAFGIAATMPLLYPVAGSWRAVILITGIPALLSVALWWGLAKNPARPNTLLPKNRIYHGSWMNRTTSTLAIILIVVDVHFYALGAWLPTFISEKGAGAELAGFIGSIPIFATIPASVVIPWISDKRARRKPFFWVAGIGNAVAFGLLILTPLQAGSFVAFLLGFSLASIMLMCYIVPAEIVNFESIGKAMGFIVSVGHIGGIVGPYFTGFVRDLTGSFAPVFLIDMGLSTVIIGLSLTLPETGRRIPSKT